MKKLFLAFAVVSAIGIASCDKGGNTSAASTSVDSCNVSVDTTMVSASATVDVKAECDGNEECSK